MRAVAALVSLGIALLAVAGVARFVSGPSPSAASPRPSPEHASPVATGDSAPAIRPAASDVTAAAEVDRLAAPIAPPPPPPPEPEGIEDGGAAPAPEGDFAAKYAGQPQPALLRALAELEARLQRSCDRELEQRFADGRYVEHRIERGDRRPPEEIAASLASPGWIHRARIESRTEAGSSPQGATLLLVQLSPDEVPALYELAAERDWLRRFLAPSEQ